MSFWKTLRFTTPSVFHQHPSTVPSKDVSDHRMSVTPITNSDRGKDVVPQAVPQDVKVEDGGEAPNSGKEGGDKMAKRTSYPKVSWGTHPPWLALLYANPNSKFDFSNQQPSHPPPPPPLSPLSTINTTTTTQSESTTSSLEISDPNSVERTLHVEWDPINGTFKGLPACWADLLPAGTVKDAVKLEGGVDTRNGKILPVKPNRRIRNSVVAGHGLPPKGISTSDLQRKGPRKEASFVKRMSVAMIELGNLALENIGGECVVCCL